MKRFVCVLLQDGLWLGHIGGFEIVWFSIRWIDKIVAQKSSFCKYGERIRTGLQWDKRRFRAM